MHKRNLSDGYCARCECDVTALAQQYPYDHPDHYDGVSEFHCPRCGRREGRWSGKVLTGEIRNGDADAVSEPVFGIERG